jgi:hypothetical protein
MMMSSIPNNSSKQTISLHTLVDGPPGPIPTIGEELIPVLEDLRGRYAVLALEMKAAFRNTTKMQNRDFQLVN